MELQLANEGHIELLIDMYKLLREDEQCDNRKTDTFLRKSLLKWMNEEYDAYLFTQDQKVVGYALINIDSTPKYIKHFIIRREHRRKGYGKKAFQLIYEKFDREPLDLDVFVWNERAIRFYESIGFQPRCYMMRYPTARNTNLPITD